MAQSILTIAIPTYNRTSQIQKQVRLILPQLNDFVSLIVYDNCSSTEIKSLFTDEELSKFVIVRNAINVGADANIARCFENCTTKWLWTLSDDDWITDDAVSIVLKYILEYPDILFFNFWNRNNIYIENFDDMCHMFKDDRFYSVSFAMSLCVYNMSKLKQSLRFYYEYLSSMLGTIILVLKYYELNQHEKCFYINTSIISMIDTEVCWSYTEYIKRSLLFLTAFDKKYQKTLFRGYHLTNYYLISINRSGSVVTVLDRFRLFKVALFSQGVINALLYNPLVVIRLFCHLMKRTRILSYILSVDKNKKIDNCRYSRIE